MIQIRKYDGTIGYLLGLVTEAASLIRACGTGDADDGGELAVLPAANPLQEPHHIRLLLPP